LRFVEDRLTAPKTGRPMRRRCGPAVEIVHPIRRRAAWPRRRPGGSVVNAMTPRSPRPILLLPTGDRLSRRSNAPMRIRRNPPSGRLRGRPRAAMGPVRRHTPPRTGRSFVARPPIEDRRPHRRKIGPEGQGALTFPVPHDPSPRASCEGCTRILVCPWRRAKATVFLQQFIRKTDTPCLPFPVDSADFLVIFGIVHKTDTTVPSGRNESLFSYVCMFFKSLSLVGSARTPVRRRRGRAARAGGRRGRGADVAACRAPAPSSRWFRSPCHRRAAGPIIAPSGIPRTPSLRSWDRKKAPWGRRAPRPCPSVGPADRYRGASAPAGVRRGAGGEFISG
jgi:hypothetical protein